MEPKDLKNNSVLVDDYIAGLKECLAELSARDIEEAAGLILEAYKKGRRVFIMGNGGSATTAMHFARDLQIGTAAPGKPRIQATCLADNTAFVTAIANDINYESIFREQLVGVVGKGDVVIGISASGNSPNVLRAIEYANQNGAVTIGLVGFGGGKLKSLAGKSIVISKKNYQMVEDIHMALAHMIPFWLKNEIEKL
jgi:D-sedoheptulose 7-phosphate isomerase